MLLISLWIRMKISFTQDVNRIEIESLLRTTEPNPPIRTCLRRTTPRTSLFLRTDGAHPLPKALCLLVQKYKNMWVIQEKSIEIVNIIRCPQDCKKPRLFWLMNICMKYKRTVIKGIFITVLSVFIVSRSMKHRTT